MIYVGLVLYNSVADLPACAAGLRAQALPDVAIVALDNASSDGSAAWVRQHLPEARLVESGDNIGYGRAHNRILASLDLRPGDTYVALNPDAELRPGYLATLQAALLQRADIGWATGKLLLKAPDGASGAVYSAGHAMLRSGFAFNIGHGMADGAAFGHSREVFGAPGAAVMYRMELIDSLTHEGSFFDPAMFMYAEDTDVDWRARRQGWRCWYAADAVALHRGSAPDGLLKMTAVANRYLSVLKNASRRDLLCLNLPFMVAHCLARLAVTPRMGAHLTATVLRNASAVLRRRQRAAVDRRTLDDWYRWSARQPTTQQPALSLASRRAPVTTPADAGFPV